MRKEKGGGYLKAINEGCQLFSTNRKTQEVELRGGQRPLDTACHFDDAAC